MKPAASGILCALLLAGVATFMAGCATEDQIVDDAIKNTDASFISSVVPNAAPPGARVRLIGGDFGEQPGEKGMVKLLPGGGYQAVRVAVETWGDKLIYIRVPQVPATTNLDSRLEVIDSRGRIAYSPVPFHVETIPTSQTKGGLSPGAKR